MNESWEFKWIHFSGICAKEYYNLLNSNGLILVNIEELGGISVLLDEVEAIMTNDVNLLDLKISLLMTQLITKLILHRNNQLNNKMYSQHKNDINNAIKFITDNYNKDIKVDQLSNVSHLSKYYFIKVFKAYTGSSPYEYLINYRITMSKKKLLNTNLNINELSQDIGFIDSNSFIKCFKRIVGTTPLKYRNHWRT
jgi:AraC-like DNA-binding protein